LYEIKNYSDNTIRILKKIDCKYHIFTFEKSIINGFLYFLNPRRENMIKRMFLNENVEFLEINDVIMNECYYKTNENYWEKGTYPSQGRKKQGHKKENMEIVIMPEKQETSLNHSNNQSFNNELINQNTSLLEQNKEICKYLMKQNQELLEEIKELKQKPNITNNIEKIENKIENNKTFNINLFLNEECKNAITLGEFVNSLKIEDSDLFYAKDKGLSEAITKIFERGLKNYDINTRPLHCTDIKRDTVHIKEKAGWIREKGSESKSMKNAIKQISNKNIEKLTQYINENPDYNNVQSNQYEDCLKMMRHILGAEEDTDKTEKKIFKNISSCVYLNNVKCD
jgi:hypothetical protein